MLAFLTPGRLLRDAPAILMIALLPAALLAQDAGSLLQLPAHVLQLPG